MPHSVQSNIDSLFYYPDILACWSRQPTKQHTSKDSTALATVMICSLQEICEENDAEDERLEALGGIDL